MPNPNPTDNHTPLRYLDAAGHEHHVIAKRCSDGRWQILDVLVVETLTGHDDGRAAADALARDYATNQHHPRRIAA